MTEPAPLLLDTHIWLRFLGLSGGLRESAIRAIEAAAVHARVFVSVISIWELALLVRRGTLDLHGPVERWAQDALAKPGLQLLPFTPRIAIESVNLPKPMHGDPADRILIASARVERLTLVTLDKDMLAFAKLMKLPCLQA